MVLDISDPFPSTMRNYITIKQFLVCVSGQVLQRSRPQKFYHVRSNSKPGGALVTLGGGRNCYEDTRQVWVRESVFTGSYCGWSLLDGSLSDEPADDDDSRDKLLGTLRITFMCFAREHANRFLSRCQRCIF